MIDYAEDLREAAIGSTLIVDLEEDFFWSSDIPSDPSARAREHAEAAQARLGEQGIEVQILGTGAYVDESTLIYAGVAHYSYVVELVSLDPDRFQHATIGVPLAAAAVLPAALLTGTLALAWPVVARVSKVEWIEIRAAAGEALETVGAGFSFVRGLSSNLALIALVGAAIYFLPRPRH